MLISTHCTHCTRTISSASRPPRQGSGGGGGSVLICILNLFHQKTNTSSSLLLLSLLLVVGTVPAGYPVSVAVSSLLYTCLCACAVNRWSIVCGRKRVVIESAKYMHSRGVHSGLPLPLSLPSYISAEEVDDDVERGGYT